MTLILFLVYLAERVHFNQHSCAEVSQALFSVVPGPVLQCLQRKKCIFGANTQFQWLFLKTAF